MRINQYLRMAAVAIGLMIACNGNDRTSASETDMTGETAMVTTGPATGEPSTGATGSTNTGGGPTSDVDTGATVATEAATAAETGPTTETGSATENSSEVQTGSETGDLPTCKSINDMRPCEARADCVWVKNPPLCTYDCSLVADQVTCLDTEFCEWVDGVCQLGMFG